jgi:hypothetical protein
VKRVVIIGGQSQGFGFGLNDDETYAAVAARSTCGPVEIHNVALVGVSNPMNWDIYMRSPVSRTPADHIVLAMYWYVKPGWREEMEAYRVRHHTWAVVDGWNFAVPSWLPDPLRALHVVVRVVSRLTPPPSVPPEPDAPAAGNLSPQQEFARAMAAWAKQNGAKFTVMILPIGLAKTQPLQQGLDDIRFLDLEQAARNAGMLGELLPDTHFNRKLAAFLGQRLGEEICAVDFPGKSPLQPPSNTDRGQ